MIPEGYRLLTSADIGKVFGVDLEPSIFIDTSATLTNSIITASFVALDSSNEDLDSSNDLIRGAYVEDGWGYQIEFNYGIYSYHYFVKLGEFDQEYVDEINSISNINGTITAVGYNGNDSWNTWLYVKDIEASDPYNITSTRPKITINCKGKIMTKDLTITREFWDGSYEEVVNGYTVTLQLGTYLSRNPFTSDTGYTYSIDGGVTKIPLYNKSVPIVLNNVQTIGFYGTSALSLHLGSTPEGSEYGYVHGGNGIYENVISVDKDTTIYVSASEYGSGGGSD